MDIETKCTGCGKLLTVAPKEAANGKPEWPLTPYDKRG